MKIKFHILNFIPLFVLILMAGLGLISWWVVVAIVISRLEFKT